MTPQDAEIKYMVVTVYDADYETGVVGFISLERAELAYEEQAKQHGEVYLCEVLRHT